MDWWIDLSVIVRNFGLVPVAMIGIYFAYRRVAAADRQTELSRREHVADLFNRSVEQLGSDKLEIRLGAIITLEQISNDFPDLTTSVFDIIASYVRERSKDYGEREPPVDIARATKLLNIGER